jgi:hypothetical protein
LTIVRWPRIILGSLASTQQDRETFFGAAPKPKNRGEGLIQFDEPLACFKVGEYLREEWLKPLGKSGVGAIADADPRYGGFVCGGQQEHVLEIFILRDDGLGISDGIVPDRLIR